MFGHTNLALYAHAHRLSFSVTAEDKQVETGFFGLFLKLIANYPYLTYICQINQKNTSVSNIYICLVCPVMKGWIVPNALKQWRTASITHITKGFHLPPHKCETNILFFLLKGQILINSEEYAGTIINSGEFVLQAIASKVEILAMTDSEGILYTFDDPKAFCYDRYTYILKNVPPPLISEPLKIKPEIKLFLEGLLPI